MDIDQYYCTVQGTPYDNCEDALYSSAQVQSLFDRLPWNEVDPEDSESDPTSFYISGNFGTIEFTYYGKEGFEIYLCKGEEKRGCLAQMFMLIPFVLLYHMWHEDKYASARSCAFSRQEARHILEACLSDRYEEAHAAVARL